MHVLHVFSEGLDMGVYLIRRHWKIGLLSVFPSFRDLRSATLSAQ